MRGISHAADRLPTISCPIPSRSTYTGSAVFFFLSPALPFVVPGAWESSADKTTHARRFTGREKRKSKKAEKIK
jgi:hypothetical protein